MYVKEVQELQRKKRSEASEIVKQWKKWASDPTVEKNMLDITGISYDEVSLIMRLFSAVIKQQSSKSTALLNYRKESGYCIACAKYCARIRRHVSERVPSHLLHYTKTGKEQALDPLKVS